ncbi:MAG: hypothetical protein NUW01_16525 [Gemmatimonadaceae bacterium]|nr:hypothetical protein [Gemmatimonadaceae bacterium]
MILRDRRMQLVLALVAVVATGCRERKQEYEGPYGRQVAEAIPLIERGTGLRFKRPPKVEARSKAQVREFVLAQITKPVAQREMAGQEAAYKRFGMIPDTLNLREYLVSLLEEQIVGYYDPATDVLYVVEGSPDDIVGLTITHELVHALQDQYVDLEAQQNLEGENDRQSAGQAVFEGQAVYEQIAAMLGGGNVAVNLPGGWDRVREMIRENQASMPVFGRAPLVVQETLIFPYLSGAEFIRGFKTRNPAGTPYSDMPVSTEQILHPAAYFGTRDHPTRITLGPVRGTKRYENTLGEFETRLFLYQHTEDQNDAIRGATGWDGDRYALIDTPAGEALVWITVWDSAVEAGEFREVMQSALERKTLVGGSAESETTRVYTNMGRTSRLITAEVGGRPLVIYTDAPASVAGELVDIAGIKLEESAPAEPARTP